MLLYNYINIHVLFYQIYINILLTDNQSEKMLTDPFNNNHILINMLTNTLMCCKTGLPTLITFLMLAGLMQLQRNKQINNKKIVMLFVHLQGTIKFLFTFIHLAEAYTNFMRFRHFNLQHYVSTLPCSIVYQQLVIHTETTEKKLF